MLLLFSWWCECKNCGIEVFTESHTHCTRCGSELEYKFDQGFLCSACGEDVDEDWSFCGYCGTDLEWWQDSITGEQYTLDQVEGMFP